ncbi:MAG: hypothetical protein AAFQ90_12735 [Pseudomonadota bacterium]
MLRVVRYVLAASAWFGALQAANAQAPIPADPFASQCRVIVTPAPPSWDIRGYDPFADAAAEATFNVTFLNQSDVECVFSPNFELTQPPFGLSKGGRERIAYAILNLTESQDVTPRAGRSQRRSASRAITLAPRQSRSLLYRLVVDRTAINSAGTFSQELVLEAQDENFRSFGGAPISLGLVVLPSARIGLAGAYTINDGQAFVDLGELRSGVAPVPLALRVNSTGRYAIDVSSANSGRLRLGSSEWSIPYEMIIGDETVNLRGLRRISQSNKDAIGVDVLPVRFIIGNTSNRRAGRYSDIVSISVTAR